MERSFAGRVVWLTGASSGIGEAMAIQLGALGARVIISSRNASELDRVKHLSQGPSENIHVLPLDVTDPQMIASTADKALELYGRIDVLILNAGIVARDLAIATDLSIDRRIMETNYFGTIALAKAVLPAMIAQGGGQLTVISSLSGKYGVPRLSAYSASKHALHGFFGSLRAETIRQGIKITMIIPGFINTPIISKALDGKGGVRNSNLQVNERGMSAERCASRILHAIKHEKQEALIGGSEMLSVRLYHYFPGTFRSLIANNPMRRLRNALPWFFR
jgi:dehydrogenase/reductase SDR family member 7B